MSQEENVAPQSPATPFSVSSEVEGGATVLAVVGELDLSTAPQLDEHLRRAGAKLVVDFSACEFIDSTGMALIVRAAQGSDGNGARIVLCGLNEQVLRVLTISGVKDLIPTTLTRQEAIDALNSQPETEGADAE